MIIEAIIILRSGDFVQLYTCMTPTPEHVSSFDFDDQQFIT